MGDRMNYCTNFLPNDMLTPRSNWVNFDKSYNRWDRCIYGHLNKERSN